MIGWAIEALAASTLLMLVVLALRGPVAARFGAQAAYLLWLLPALRMMLPRIPQAAEPVRMVPIHLDITKLVAAAQTHGRTTVAAAAPSPAVDWVIIGLVLWLGGALAYLTWQLGRHYRFMSIALAYADEGFRRGGIKVRLSPAVSGPLAAGIVHRHILLPEDFALRYSGAEQQLALAHELAHHRRGDLIANGAALAVLALHWFNPIAHWAYRAFRTDQELACDATVLGAAPGARADYGSALIKSARAGASTAACAMGPTHQLKRRMIMIAQSSSSRARRIAGIGLVVLMTTAGLGLTASGSIASPSLIAPLSARPLFASAPQPRGIEIADRTAATAHPAPPIPPVPLVQPAPPVRAVPPVPPVPPLSPIPPVPPVPMSRAQIEALKAAGAQAAAAAKEAMANIDVAAITREAMAEARAELARECTHAKPGPADESDTDAVARLAAGCVDMAAIQQEVQAALRDASAEIRASKDMTNAQRARALAAVERARGEMARQPAR